MSLPNALTSPIAIVGGGPVGLMLALLLDRHGVKSVLFNIDETTRWHPKGSTHNSRTVEHYRRLGISQQIRQLGLPLDHPTDVAFFTRLNAWELARIRMPTENEKARDIAASATTEQILEPIFRGNQMFVERYLFEHARTRPNITMRYGWRVDSFTQDADGVTIKAERDNGSEAETWRAQYLAGCDGGRSTVRRALNFRYEGPDRLAQDFIGGPMLTTYLRAPALEREFLVNKRAYHYWLINAEFRTLFVALNGKDEFILWTKPENPDAQPDDASIIRVMQRCTGADIPVEIISHSPWTAGAALVAERFADRRVFLAGDSVHLFTPTGGFGMNTGIDDAANLSWKLAAMVQGWGGPNLMASYEPERKHIAIRNTNQARQFARTAGSVVPPAEIEQPTAAGDAARREVGALLSTFNEEFASIGVQLGARYDGSSIVTEDGTPPVDDFFVYRPTTIPGGRLPHSWIGSGRQFGDSLFDHLGVGFTLLRVGDDAPDGQAFEEAARARGIPLKVLSIPGTEDLRDLYEKRLILIRPDQHVAWRGDSAPDDLDRLMAKAIGA